MDATDTGRTLSRSHRWPAIVFFAASHGVVSVAVAAVLFLWAWGWQLSANQALGLIATLLPTVAVLTLADSLGFAAGMFRTLAGRWPLTSRLFVFSAGLGALAVLIDLVGVNVSGALVLRKAESLLNPSRPWTLLGCTALLVAGLTFGLGRLAEGSCDATRSRTDAPACLRCGYNLAGNVSGRCPECGTDIQKKLAGLSHAANA